MPRSDRLSLIASARLWLVLLDDGLPGSVARLADRFGLLASAHHWLVGLGDGLACFVDVGGVNRLGDGLHIVVADKAELALDVLESILVDERCVRDLDRLSLGNELFDGL